MAKKHVKISVTDYHGSVSESTIDLLPSFTELTDAVDDVETSVDNVLPDVTTTDNGDVLTVVEGDWNKADVPTELPAVSSTDNGNVLTVVDGVWNKAAAPTGLPAVTADDNGDVLTVSEGAWTKAAPSGGDIVIIDYNGSATYGDVYNAAISGKAVVLVNAYTGSSSSSYDAYLLIKCSKYSRMGQEVVDLEFSRCYSEMGISNYVGSNQPEFNIRMGLNIIDNDVVGLSKNSETGSLSVINTNLLARYIRPNTRFALQEGNVMSQSKNTYYDILFIDYGPMATTTKITIKDTVTGDLYETGELSLDSNSIVFTPAQS